MIGLSTSWIHCVVRGAGYLHTATANLAVDHAFKLLAVCARHAGACVHHGCQKCFDADWIMHNLQATMCCTVQCAFNCYFDTLPQVFGVWGRGLNRCGSWGVAIAPVGHRGGPQRHGMAWHNASQAPDSNILPNSRASKRHTSQPAKQGSCGSWQASGTYTQHSYLATAGRCPARLSRTHQQL